MPPSSHNKVAAPPKEVARPLRLLGWHFRLLVDGHHRKSDRRHDRCATAHPNNPSRASTTAEPHRSISASASINCRTIAQFICDIVCKKVGFVCQNCINGWTKFVHNAIIKCRNFGCWSFDEITTFLQSVHEVCLKLVPPVATKIAIGDWVKPHIPIELSDVKFSVYKLFAEAFLRPEDEAQAKHPRHRRGSLPYSIASPRVPRQNECPDINRGRQAPVAAGLGEMPVDTCRKAQTVHQLRRRQQAGAHG